MPATRVAGKCTSLHQTAISDLRLSQFSTSRVTDDPSPPTCSCLYCTLLVLSFSWNCAVDLVVLDFFCTFCSHKCSSLMSRNIFLVVEQLEKYALLRKKKIYLPFIICELDNDLSFVQHLTNCFPIYRNYSTNPPICQLKITWWALSTTVSKLLVYCNPTYQRQRSWWALNTKVPNCLSPRHQASCLRRSLPFGSPNRSETPQKNTIKSNKVWKNDEPVQFVRCCSEGTFFKLIIIHGNPLKRTLMFLFDGYIA